MGKIEQMPVADGPIPNPRRGSRRRRGLLIASIVLALAAILLVVAATVEFSTAAIPDLDEGVLNAVRLPHPQGDLWGDPQWAVPAIASDRVPGLVTIDDRMLHDGRSAFYEETFGNQAFFHDVMGITAGPLGLTDVMQAIWDLDGAATTNLKLRLPRDVVVGDQRLVAGTMLDTGLDVPAGGSLPLGMVLHYRSFGAKVGMSCALCHATVDPATGLVVEGAPNQDLAIGLLLALAPNTTAFFAHTDVVDAVDGLQGEGLTGLPDQAALERAVDTVLLQWPPGSFDATIDLVANPTRIPHAFTTDAHPYGWSGMAQAGPFDGLSAMVNNLHAQNTDTLTQVTISEPLFGIGPERYLALILRGAGGRYRFDPQGPLRPSEHLAQVDPTPRRPGLNTVLMPSTYPMITPVAMDGVLLGIPGRRAWAVTNAISAFLDTLQAPVWPLRADEDILAHGRTVFERAGCVDCHQGPAATDHRVIPIAEIGTEPSRARALARTREIFTPQAQVFAFDQVVGEEDRPLRELTAPISETMAESIARGFAHDDAGGYRTTALVALPWQAPYLHDGGVAVGPGGAVGIPNTLSTGVAVDPAASLHAVIDRTRRAQVGAANRADDFGWSRLHVRGVGHEYWVDPQTGFDAADQAALIEYLLARRYEPAAADALENEPATPSEPAVAAGRSQGD
jgi:hypothetical protein